MAETAQLEFTAEELLQSAPVEAPLIAGGVRCHGGFDAEGRYVSPRTLEREPAIDSWRAHHTHTFGSAVIEVPLATWPEHFPNVAQARFLVRSGVPEPLIATLTRIGMVEGYGANIRRVPADNMQRFFVEDVRGTAIDHLGRGLFEAHGRDEAGWELEAGHKEMWFAARDIAFGPCTSDIDVEAMLARLGIGPSRSGSSGGAGGSGGAGAGGGGPARLLPADIAPELELVVRLMTRVLFIEVSAFHTFAWAEAWLGDADLVAGDGEAGRLVSYIRADERPHVRYLAIALTEMRDRTWIGTGGRHHAGADMVDLVWRHLLDQSLGTTRQQNRDGLLREVARWCEKRPGGDDIFAEFNALATPAA